MRDSVLRLLRRVLLSVAGTSLVGLCLLWAVAALPSAPLEYHVRTAVDAGRFSENYPQWLWFRPLDMYTECAGINVALELRPAFTDVLAMRNFQECKGLQARFADNTPPAVWPYARYWHGYQVFLKPLYTWLPAAAVPWVSSMVALLLFGGLFCVAAAHLGKAVGAALTLSFLLPGSLTVFPLVTHGVQFWWVLGSCISVFLAHRSAPSCAAPSAVSASWGSMDAPTGLFAAIGAGAAFVCFFNMESLSLGMALLCHCLLRLREGRPACAILYEGLWLCTAWGAAFVAMWLVKWGLAWLALPAGTDLLGQTVSTYAARSPEMVGKAILANVLRMPWTVAMGAIVLLAWRFYKKNLCWPRGWTALLLPAAIPLLWMCLMPGHAEKHSMFMPVILWPSMAAVVVGFVGGEACTPHEVPAQ